VHISQLAGIDRKRQTDSVFVSLFIITGFASAASSGALEIVKPSTAGHLTALNKLSLAPSNKIT
jgi:hypothetical protein